MPPNAERGWKHLKGNGAVRGWKLSSTEAAALFGGRMVGESAYMSIADPEVQMEQQRRAEREQQKCAKAKEAINRCELMTTIIVTLVCGCVLLALWLSGHRLI
ncbi:hypothetical protein JKP88DRAFT_247340 [Tribonema minus]|uniref:Uncharacterized protein n=1 Tax=Tribonema minus TaxID=303371 RepID=A0A835YQF8_9STRA|nr:hypothetical protein JKP88DRAFT_247340 [Tribonema minus]